MLHPSFVTHWHVCFVTLLRLVTIHYIKYSAISWKKSFGYTLIGGYEVQIKMFNLGLSVNILSNKSW